MLITWRGGYLEATTCANRPKRCHGLPKHVKDIMICKALGEKGLFQQHHALRCKSKISEHSEACENILFCYSCEVSISKASCVVMSQKIYHEPSMQTRLENCVNSRFFTTTHRSDSHSIINNVLWMRCIQAYRSRWLPFGAPQLLSANLKVQWLSILLWCVHQFMQSLSPSLKVPHPRTDPGGR